MQHATLLYICLGRRVKEGEMDEAWKWREIVTEFWWGILEERDLGVDMRIILKKNYV